MTIKKPFDIFVSYSHSDKAKVVNIAETLKQRKVSLWFDGWEMKPGDILRKRVLHGIENANYFLIMISENSLHSSWVDYELNSAMINEIESHNVKVIPSIIGNIDFKQLPLDIQAKYCIDFRTIEAFQQSIDALVDLVQPELRQRQELLKKLSNPIPSTETLKELRVHATSNRDQTIQKAAIKGLTKIGNPQAVLAITERVLNSWGMSAIEKAMKSLSQLKDSSGIFALTSTILCDDRFIHEKLDLIKNTVKEYDPKTHLTLRDVKNSLGNRYNYKETIPLAMSKLVAVENEDISCGAKLAILSNVDPHWKNTYASGQKIMSINFEDSNFIARETFQNDEDIIIQNFYNYCESRLPGLWEMILTRRTDTFANVKVYFNKAFLLQNLSIDITKHYE